MTKNRPKKVKTPPKIFDDQIDQILFLSKTISPNKKRSADSKSA